MSKRVEAKSKQQRYINIFWVTLTVVITICTILYYLKTLYIRLFCIIMRSFCLFPVRIEHITCNICRIISFSLKRTIIKSTAGYLGLFNITVTCDLKLFCTYLS